MPEMHEQTQVFRFDQMAVQVKDKVEPAEADVDRYVGLEHIDDICEDFDAALAASATF